MTPSAVTDFDFVPAQAWDTYALKLANEEAAHAVFAVLLDIPVLEVRIDCDEQFDGCAGICRTKTPEDFTDDDLRRQLVATLAGPMAIGETIEWPPQDSDEPGDENVAAILVRVLDLDERGWNIIVTLVDKTLRHPAVRSAHKALAGALLERGALPGAEVREICSAAIDAA